MSKGTEISGYDLSRAWFNWCFENPDLISPNHTAIYFFAIEHCNRLGWKSKFGFPTQMVMDAIGIKKHQTYIRYFSDLCEWGFIKLVQKSANQYSANIISLVNAMPKNGKALDKAFITHAAKQTESMGQSTGQSNSSIDKQLTNKPNNNKQGYRAFAHLSLSIEDFDKLVESGFTREEIDGVLDSIENYKNNHKYKSLYLTAKKWLQNDRKKNGQGQKPNFNEHLQKANEAREQSDEMIKNYVASKQQ